MPFDDSDFILPLFIGGHARLKVSNRGLVPKLGTHDWLRNEREHKHQDLSQAGYPVACC